MFQVPAWKTAILVALVAVLPLLALAACGVEEAPTLAPPIATEASQRDPTATAMPTEPPAGTPVPTMPAAATVAPEATTAPTGPVATRAPEPTAAPATPQPTAEPATPQPTAAPATPQPTAAPATPQPTAAPAGTALVVEACEGSPGGQLGNCAPEFRDTQEWINSGPLTMESLRGKVVLIDFWTYTCINCIRTIPFLQTWHERYADEGLVIIGVHTPEFEFEKIYDNVVESTIDMGVAWPVVQDNNFSVWRSYSNRYWPAKYLIDASGEIRFRHFGEGRYAETEQEIRALLAEAGMAAASFAQPLPGDQQTAARPAGSDRQRTPELFAGWKFVINHYRSGRGLYVGQVEPYNNNRDEVVELEIPPEIFPDRIYFKGSWYIGPESVRHARKTEDYSDEIVLAYSARSVNAVLTSESGEPYRVRIKVNGQYLTEENKGDDVIIGEDGESYLMVESPKAYKLIEHEEWQEQQVLQMFSKSDDFGLFSFTFGTYEDGF